MRRGPIELAMIAVAGGVALVCAMVKGLPLPGAAPVEQGMRSAPPARKVRPADLPQNPLLGLAVVSADGRAVGRVLSIDAEPDGTISAINVTAGGLLGLGARLVAIPAGKFVRAGDHVRLTLTAAEVGALPTLS